MPDVGDVTTPTLTVDPFDGTTAATLTIYRPDGTTTTPTPTTTDLGATWTSTAVIYDAAGWWLFDWTVAGTGAGAQTQRVFVAPAQQLPPDIPPIYATLDELKSRLGGVSGSGEDAALLNALATASRGIDQFCRRQFSNTTTATARVFNPTSTALVTVDDFHTTDDLVIAIDSGDGSYANVLASSVYQLEPLNGMVSGEAGWPYSRIRALSAYFPCYYQHAPIRVTAQWGWASVPSSVNEACLALAEETYKLKDAPFGVAGFGDMGVVRIRENPKVAAMLAAYRIDPVLVA